MQFMRKTFKPVTHLIIVSFVFLNSFSPAVHAEMVGTQSLIEDANHQANRERLRSFYDRKDVQTALQRHGISASEAKARIASLTDREVQVLGKRIDQMPAGAGGLEVALILFLVLIVLELTGVINIFSFI